jgi:PHD/YefM family antitoxin component YafN of YafNO toxin-antitoxin module
MYNSFMNTVSTTILRNNLADVINELVEKTDFFLVTKRGEVTSALVNIDLFEDLLALSNKKYLASIRKARQEYEKGDIFSHKEAFGEI